MKKIIIIFITTISFLSCSDTKKNEKKSEIEAENISKVINDRNKWRLGFDTEKIEILSIIYGIQIDTLDNIILDYINSTPTNLSVLSDSIHEDKNKYVKIIDSLSGVYKINKTDLAKIIYDYKFKSKDEE